MKLIQRGHKYWKEIIANKRDRFVHPEEDRRQGDDAKFYIMQKRSWIRVNDDGGVDVGLRQVSIQDPKASEQIQLTPRLDLEKLRDYLSQAAIAIRSEVERVAQVPL